MDRPQSPDRTPLAWCVLVAAVLEAVAPVVTISGPGSSPGNGSGAELLITPQGWAFSIWSVIYALAIAQALAVLLRADAAVPRRLQVDQLVLYLAAVAWIAVAGLDSSVLTAVVLAVMLAAALDAVLTAARHHCPSRWATVLTRAAVGLYAGWVTAAFFLNAATAAVALDLAEAGSETWQLVVLAIATVTLGVVLIRARGVVAYAVAGVWALVGIAATGIRDGSTAVTATAVVGVVVVAVAALAARRPGQRPVT
ncbi:hypothetical protein [Nocardioides sp. TF02-7]|uniref:hypothetical protein n=1 Tax=Nocardioides sp. TF02-7 TaxID=2917724 RepID=UPI001F06DEAC|nr:hypothetical protein [Nocardioides sp. TF02-7]UMG91059.1 hypothetical protein MF408_12630 [Nocardioides sp. TF02-7]